jgi:DNA-binding GntR family transcriptional regulator
MNNRIISPALFENVAELLRERIATKQLQPGDRIDEQVLTKEFGISRTPLREALKVLQGEGLVVLVPRRGCIVAELSERDLDDIYAIVALLESRCAAAVAASANERDIKRLQLLTERHQQAAASGVLKRITETNTALHGAMQEIAGNRWQTDILTDLRRVLKLARGLTISLPGRLEQSVAEHRDLLIAIQNHDATEAGNVMHQHVMRQREALRYEALHHPEAPVRSAGN